MASFTDIIPQFNPYVQQLPVEAMVQVGMEKQKRYDEGIQKIQSQIDTIGGMDIYKPAHKMYLQSKLNELGNNLQMVAAGDFSNFQLVNSVGGMIGQVVKDPVVKNAYESTQLLRKQQALMEDARKNGKSSPDNEWWFMNSVNSWQNDPDLMTKFTGEYIEYRDVDKKLRDVAGKIKDMEKSIDIPYQRNADGSYKLDKDGNPMIDDAMLRIKVKGTPAEKILNNFYSSLDENDKRQLMITGNYHYRNATKATFQNDIIGTYSAQKKATVDQIAKLAVELNTNDNLTSTQRAEIEAAINTANEKVKAGFFEKEAASKISEIDKVTNMEDFKYRTYTQKYLTNLSQDLSNISYSEEYNSNPYAQMDMEKKKLQFSVNRAKVEDAQFWANYNLTRDKWEWEKEEKRKEKEPYSPIVDYGGLGTDVPKPKLEDLQSNINSTQQAINDLKNKTNLNKLFPDLEGNEAAQLKAADDLVKQYAANPTSIRDNAQRKFVESMRGLQIQLAQQNGLMASTLDHVVGYQKEISNVFAGTPGFLNKNGEEVYSAEDLYKAYAIVQKNTSVFQYGRSVNVEAASKEAPSNLKILVRQIGKYNNSFSATGYGGNWADPVTKQYAEKALQIYQQFASKVNNVYNKKVAAESDYLAKRMPEVQVTYGTLNMDDKITQQRVENLIGNAVRAYDQLGASDQENLSDFSPSTLNDWRTGEGAKDLKYIVEKQYGGKGNLVIYKGDSKQVIPMTPSDMVSYFPSFTEKTGIGISGATMTDVKFIIGGSPSKTTNPVRAKDAVNAMFSGYDIPGIAYSNYAPLTRIDIEGADTNDGGDNDVFQVRLYAYDNGVWKNDVLNQQGFVGPAGVTEIINLIGPATVQQVLRKK